MCYDVRLSHLNKDYLLTYLLTYLDDMYRNRCKLVRAFCTEDAGPAFFPDHQGRRRGVDCGGHVHPTFPRGCSWDWRRSNYKELQLASSCIFSSFWPLFSRNRLYNHQKSFLFQGARHPDHGPLDPAGGYASRHVLDVRPVAQIFTVRRYALARSLLWPGVRPSVCHVHAFHPDGLRYR